MTIHARLALLAAIVAVALAAASYGVQRTVLQERFHDLERQLARDEVERFRVALARERERLAQTTADWAAWDEAHRFLRGEEPEFAGRNLDAASLENLACSALLFVAPDGRVIERAGPAAADLQIAGTAAGVLADDHPLLGHDLGRPAVTGVVRTSRGPALVASQPVTTSRHEGPAVGWIVALEVIDDDLVGRLAQPASSTFRLVDVLAPDCDEEVLDALERLRDTSAPAFGAADGEESLRAYGPVHDLFGEPVCLVRAEFPRTISERGEHSLRLATAATLGSSALILGGLFLLLRATLERPLRRLTQHAERIGRSGDLAGRSGIDRDDEIGRLARAFDDMVGRLAASRAEFTEVAHRAGMTEAARAVLHNAGNVLTGVSVSADALGDSLRRSRTDGLLRGVDLLAEHRGGIAEFLERDARGRVLPEYLIRAAAAVRDERASMLAESDRLRRNVAHAVEVVKRQDALAWGAPAVSRETLQLATVLSGAAMQVEPECRKLGIDLEWRAPADVALVADRARLTQILVNLLANARDAVTMRREPAGAGRGGRILVEADLHGGIARFTVTDDGVGMTPEVLGRVFDGGRSSKGEGRGVGLRYCSRAAREMGGELRAESPGAGRGAVFILELPVVPSAQSPADKPAGAGAADRTGRIAAAAAGSCG